MRRVGDGEDLGREVTGVVTAVNTDGRGGHARRQLHDGEEGVVGHAAAAEHADDGLGGQGSHRTGEGRGKTGHGDEDLAAVGLGVLDDGLHKGRGAVGGGHAR